MKLLYMYMLFVVWCIFRGEYDRLGDHASTLASTKCQGDSKKISHSVWSKQEVRYVSITGRQMPLAAVMFVCMLH